MRFAVQVREKIKHGARGGVTVLAPVVSCVIVFKRLGGRSLSRSGRGDGRLVWRLPGWGRSHGRGLEEEQMQESVIGRRTVTMVTV